MQTPKVSSEMSHHPKPSILRGVLFGRKHGCVREREGACVRAHARVHARHACLWECILWTARLGHINKEQLPQKPDGCVEYGAQLSCVLLHLQHLGAVKSGMCQQRFGRHLQMPMYLIFNCNAEDDTRSSALWPDIMMRI